VEKDRERRGRKERRRRGREEERNGAMEEVESEVKCVSVTHGHGGDIRENKEIIVFFIIIIIIFLN
jgi:hypothetical protein